MQEFLNLIWLGPVQVEHVSSSSSEGQEGQDSSRRVPLEGAPHQHPHSTRSEVVRYATSSNSFLSAHLFCSLGFFCVFLFFGPILIQDYCFLAEPTRQVGQKQLETFREEISKVANNPYMFLMKKRKLPMGLLTDPTKVRYTTHSCSILETRACAGECIILIRFSHRYACAVWARQVKKMHLLEVETFQSTFGPKSTRKKPKMAGLDYDALVKAAEESSSSTLRSALHAFPVPV